MSSDVESGPAFFLKGFMSSDVVSGSVLSLLLLKGVHVLRCRKWLSPQSSS